MAPTSATPPRRTLGHAPICADPPHTTGHSFAPYHHARADPARATTRSDAGPRPARAGGGDTRRARGATAKPSAHQAGGATRACLAPAVSGAASESPVRGVHPSQFSTALGVKKCAASVSLRVSASPRAAPATRNGSGRLIVTDDADSDVIVGDVMMRDLLEGHDPTGHADSDAEGQFQALVGPLQPARPVRIGPQPAARGTDGARGAAEALRGPPCRRAASPSAAADARQPPVRGPCGPCCRRGARAGLRCRVDQAAREPRPMSRPRRVDRRPP